MFLEYSKIWLKNTLYSPIVLKIRSKVPNVLPQKIIGIPLNPTKPYISLCVMGRKSVSEETGIIIFFLWC